MTDDFFFEIINEVRTDSLTQSREAEKDIGQVNGYIRFKDPSLPARRGFCFILLTRDEVHLSWKGRKRLLYLTNRRSEGR